MGTPGSRRPRGTLSREQVMRAALAVADSGGLADLTMAGVANELGVPGEHLSPRLRARRSHRRARRRRARQMGDPRPRAGSRPRLRRRAALAQGRAAPPPGRAGARERPGHRDRGAPAAPGAHVRDPRGRRRASGDGARAGPAADRGDGRPAGVGADDLRDPRGGRAQRGAAAHAGPPDDARPARISRPGEGGGRPGRAARSRGGVRGRPRARSAPGSPSWPNLGGPSWAAPRPGADPALHTGSARAEPRVGPRPAPGPHRAPPAADLLRAGTWPAPQSPHSYARAARRDTRHGPAGPAPSSASRRSSRRRSASSCTSASARR